MNPAMGGIALMCKGISFLEVFSCCELLCLMVPLQTYIWQKKNRALLINLLTVKKQYFTLLCL